MIVFLSPTADAQLHELLEYLDTKWSKKVGSESLTKVLSAMEKN